MEKPWHPIKLSDGTRVLVVLTTLPLWSYHIFCCRYSFSPGFFIKNGELFQNLLLGFYSFLAFILFAELEMEAG